MNNIADANATEMRGWVMLMLQRAAENVNPSECNDPAVLLACSLGSDSCPAACVNKSNTEDEDSSNTPSNISDMPVAGDLTIAVADYSSEIKSVPATATVIMNAVDFKASEKITIESVKLERIGLSDKKVIKGVWFEKDGIAVSAKASLSTDGTATTRFYNNYSVNGTDTLDLVVELEGAAGSEIAFQFVNVTSTAKNVSANTKTSTVRTTNYDVAKIGFDVSGTKTLLEYKVGDAKQYEIGRFQLVNEKGSSSEDKSIIVKSLKLKNASGLNLGDTFKNLYVTRDSKTVSKSVTVDSKEMTIVFDNDEIESGKKAIYTIYAEVAQLNEVNETVQLQLKKTTDLVANEKSSNFRVAYTDDTKNNTTLRSYLFKGGKVTFTNDSSLTKTVEAAAGSTDVVIAKGTLTISEPIKLEDFVITGSISTNGATTPRSIKNIMEGHISAIKLEVNGSTYSADLDKTVYSNANATDTTATATFVFNDDIYISKTSDIRVLVNLRGNDTTVDTLSFVNLNGQSFGAGTYENSDESFTPSSAIAGAVQISKLTVKAGKFNITNKSSSTQKVVKGNSDEVVIFDGEITAKSGKVSVNDVVLTGTFKKASGEADPTSRDQITLSMSVNGEPFSDVVYKLTDTTARFSNLGEVESGSPMKIKITAQPNVSIQGEVTFQVGAEGSDNNGNDVIATPTTAAKLEITGAASATIASSSASSTVILDGANTELLTFSTTVKDGSYDLNKVEIELSSAAKTLDKQSLTLEIDGQSVGSVIYDKSANGGNMVIDGLNESLAVGKHTFAVKANANVGDEGSAIVDITKVTLNGNSATAKTMTVKKLIAKAYPVISATTKDTDLTLKIENPKDNNEDFEIVGFTINGTVTSASFNDSPINNLANINGEIDARKLSLADGDSTELVLAAAKNTTVQVTSITIRIGTNEIPISSDYTNVGKWSTFKVSAGDKGSDEKTVEAQTVTFDLQGKGDNFTQSVSKGAKASQPADPTYAGFRFVGWYKEAAGTNAWSFETAINSATTIYAKWIAQYKVTYKANSKKKGTAAYVAPAATTHDNESTVTLAAAGDYDCGENKHAAWGATDSADTAINTVTLNGTDTTVYAICVANS